MPGQIIDNRERISADDFLDWMRDPSTQHQVLRNYYIEGDLTFRPTSGIPKKTIDNCLFTNTVWLVGDQRTLIDNFSFESCWFKGNTSHTSLAVHEHSMNYLSFSKCVFDYNVEFKSCRNGEIGLDGCELKGELKINGGTNDIVFKISGAQKLSTLHEGISVSGGCNFSELSLRDIKVSGVIVFYKVYLKKIFFGKGDYNEIHFPNDSSIEDLLIRGDTRETSELTIDKFWAPNLMQFNGNLVIDNAQIMDFDVRGLKYESGYIKLQNVHFIGQVFLNNCDLGSIRFNEINFTKAQLCFDHSFIGDCLFTNIKWPEGKRVYSQIELHDNSTNSGREHLILREVYRQIKNSCIRQSNNIDALGFYRNEMDSYWSYMKRNSEEKWYDIVLVGLSKIASDFGQNFALPLLWLVVFHTVFFSVLVARYNYEGLTIASSFAQLDGREFLRGLAEFTHLINPVHRMPEDFHGGMRAVDFLMRLSGGFFIYHMIRSSRKFAKL